MAIGSAMLAAAALWLYPQVPGRRRAGWLVAKRSGVTAFPHSSNRYGRMWSGMRRALGAILFGVGIAGTGFVIGGMQAVTLAIAAGAAYWFRRRFGNTAERIDPLDLATGYDLFAAGLRSGLSLTTTLTTVSREFTGQPRRALRMVADRLALGGDAVDAWEPALRQPETAELARAARRTARSGSPLATVAAELADRTRARAEEHEHARAQRAAVWISAPLGLCFLPAFLCLGVLPTVLGMLDQVGVG